MTVEAVFTSVMCWSLSVRWSTPARTVLRALASQSKRSSAASHLRCWACSCCSHSSSICWSLIKPQRKSRGLRIIPQLRTWCLCSTMASWASHPESLASPEYFISWNCWFRSSFCSFSCCSTFSFSPLRFSRCWYVSFCEIKRATISWKKQQQKNLNVNSNNSHINTSMHSVCAQQILLFPHLHLYICDSGGLLNASERLLKSGDGLLLFARHPGGAAPGLTAQLIWLHGCSLSLKAAKVITNQNTSYSVPSTECLCFEFNYILTKNDFDCF